MSQRDRSGRFVGRMTWRQFTIGYLMLLVGGVAGSYLLARQLGIPVERAILAVCGGGFLAAALSAPNGYLFRVVRNVGWFSAIDDDAAMRGLLILLGLALLGGYVWQAATG